MSTELVPFEFAGVPMNAVREGEEFFFIVAKVCKAIEHSHTTKFTQHVSKENLNVLQVHSGGQNRDMLCLTEKGLYMALMRLSISHKKG